MKKVAFALLMCLTPSAWAGTTYTYKSLNYDTIHNYTSCTTGSCANFTIAMQTVVTFTTASRLILTSLTDITSQLTSYTASDGLTTYSSTDPNCRVLYFSLRTDATGVVNYAQIVIQRWHTSGSSHTTSDVFDKIDLNGLDLTVGHNSLCLGVGEADACTGGSGVDEFASHASPSYGTYAGWSIESDSASAVPTVSEWVLGLMAALLAVAGWITLHRQSAAA